MVFLVSLALAASALSAAQPSSAFIRDALSGSNGNASMEVFVSPDGEVLECRVLSSPLPEDRWEKLCHKSLGRDIGRGATGPDGEPIHSFVIVAKVRSDSRMRIPLAPAAFEIAVNAMPGNDERRRFTTRVIVDREGKIAYCDKSASTLTEVVCARASQHQFSIKLGKSGNPVTYMTDLVVDFVLAANAEK